jgi:hypothetical protein
MASTYSSLKIQLMGTGENSGTWGNVTNLNLGTAIEEAIVGSADVTFSSGNVTLTLTDSNGSQTARNLRLNCVGTTGGARDLIVPAIEKSYLINNGCADAITVKNSSGTGIAVPAGKTMLVYNNGTNVVDAVTHLTSLTLASALPIASGGTGITSFGSGVATFLGTPSSANLAAAVTDETGSGALVFATSPTLVTPILGTPTSGTLTNTTGFPVANLAGAGSGVLTFLATPSSANLAAAVTGETGSGALVFGTGPSIAGGALSGTFSGTPTFSDNITFSSTGAITAPVGTTGQRPTAATGMLRFNSTGSSFEGYNGSSWSSLGGAQGGVGNPFVYENDITVTASYTLTTGKNGMSAGPITIDDSVTVTVPDNSTWTIV